MTEALWAIPWREMLLPGPSWLEKVLRPAVVYLALLAIFRLTSRRGLAQATLFDFVILLLISNVVQNATIGNDNSVLGALAGALMLVVLSYTGDHITSRSHRARVFLEGKPVLLVKDGQIQHDIMERQVVTTYDLLSAIRKQGLSRLADVGFAVLELDGSISVIKADSDPRPHDCLPSEVVGGESAEAQP